MAEIKDFTIDQGSTWQPFIVLSTNDVPNDLTGYTARMQFRRTKSASVADVSLTTESSGLTITPVEGKIQFLITATETSNISGVYYYDLELITGSQVMRIMQGKITVSEEVTR